MLPLCRIGDQNNMGGVITTGSATVFAEFRPVGFIGSQISPHAPWGNPHPPHEAAVITNGSATVFADFRPVAKVGSQNSCGHSMTQGATTIITT